MYDGWMLAVLTLCVMYADMCSLADKSDKLKYNCSDSLDLLLFFVVFDSGLRVNYL